MSAPYKYDIVGSFLRDKEIKQAREDSSKRRFFLRKNQSKSIRRS